MVRARLCLALAGLSLGACECPGPVGGATGTDPFRVLSVQPVSRKVATSARFTLSFTLEVDPAGVTTDTIILIPTERVSESLISDLNSPPLSESRRDDVVAADLDVSGTTVTITPLADMPAGTDISLLISDEVRAVSGEKLTATNGQPGHHQVDFTTQGPAPRIVETSLPSGNPSQVPPNLGSLTLTADQPVTGAAVEAVRVRGLEGATDVQVGSVEVLADGITIRVSLVSSGTCQPLCPQAGYMLEAGPPLRNLEGTELNAFALELRALPTADLQGPTLVFLPFIRPSETQATVNVVTNEPATGRVLLGPPGGPYPDSYPLVASGFCTGIQAARQCPFQAVVTGLDLGTSGLGRAYGAQIEVVDGFGNVALYGEFAINTVRLPLLLVTEVYNNPPGDEDTQEFIEIENISTDVTYDMAGMWVGKLSLDSGEVTSDMELLPYGNGGTTLPPGRRMVIGGGDFDPRAVGTPEDAMVMVGDTSTLMGGLESGQDTRKRVALFMGPPDQGAAIISIFRAPEELYEPSDRFPEGASAERATTTGPDDEALWCHSASGPTPAQPNSVAGLTACP
ncbi:MAG: Ig-like domain-containing protein [Myxococcota bacterium]